MSKSHVRSRRRIAGLATVALTLALTAACGDSGDGDDGDATDSKEPIVLEDHDALLKKAEENGGEVDILLALDDLDAFAAGFEEAYPSLKANIVDFSGTDVYQRFALEAEAEAVSDDWDVAYIPPEYYSQFVDLLAHYDFKAMADNGTLAVPLDMIDHDNPIMVTPSSQLAGIGYNKDLVAPEDVPDSWDDLLDPIWADGKFVLDVRPSNLAPLVPLWGAEETYDFAAKLAAQNPTWVRGNTDALTRIQAGEDALMAFANYHSGIRAAEEDPGGPLVMKLLDPIPVRVGETMGVFDSSIADNPEGALLFIEWMTSDAAQAILDQEPFKSSIYAPGDVAGLVEGRETSIVGTSDYQELEEYESKIVEAYGFPQAINE